MNARTKSRVQRLGTALAVLFLVLALLALLAYVQGTAPAGASDPSPATPAAGTDAAATTPPLPPPTGQRAKLFDESEIVVACRSDGHKNLENAWWDTSGQSLVWGGNWFGMYDVNDIRWPAVTMGDLNNDGKSEPVSAFRDKQGRIAVTTRGDYEWYADGDAYKDVEWVDIAAGNLRTIDPNDEVVVAFEDNNHDIRLVTLVGNPGGNIYEQPNQFFGQWSDTTSGRGNVEYVAVTTGDLDGDGYDDEIVTVFEDGNDDLQCLILRDDGDGWLSLVWSRAWTNHDRGDVANDATWYENARPIDVTTGDVDGDKQDEVIIAFRSGHSYTPPGNVQLLVLDPQPDGSYNDQVYLERSLGSSGQKAATSVSVAADDLDGDGQDEIALAYNVVYSGADDRYWQQHLVTYEYVPPTAVWEWQGCWDDSNNPRACLQARSGEWTSASYGGIGFFYSANKPEAHVVIDTGDLDLDGRAEIVLAHHDHSGNVLVRAFDADAGLAERGSASVSWGAGGDTVEEFWLAVGDMNGDSWYGTYVTGSAHEEKVAQVIAVIHAPPAWPGVNSSSAKATFGATTSQSGGTSQTTQSTIGGSAKLKVPLPTSGPLLGGITGAFTHDWEKTTVVSNKQLTKLATGTSFSMSSGQNGVQFVETKYWCYDYTGPSLGTMTVCIPQTDVDPAVWSHTLGEWYTTDRTTYADSWVPVGLNLAQGMTATQSSNWTDPSCNPVAAKAVDGNTDGNYYDCSVSHTSRNTYAWWQVDLGSVQWLDAVSVWNRSDYFQSRLSNFYVFVSDNPFPVLNNPVTLATVYSPTVMNRYVSGQCGLPTTVPVGRTGRYVLVQLAGTDYLHIAEVQVWGRPQTLSQWPTARPVTTTNNTFQLTWPGGRSQSVAGNLLYTRQGNVIGVDIGSGDSAQVFNVTREDTTEHMTEGWSMQKNTLGMETKFVAASGWKATTQKNAYILQWSQSTTFSGQVSNFTSAHGETRYTYAPYAWLQQATSSEGTRQSFLVLDYWVPSIGAAADTAPAAEAPEATPSTALRAGLLVTPTVPLVGSPTHPDPATWYPTSTAVFTWTQPADDPATVAGYRWYLDHDPATSPDAVSLGLTTAYTYTGLDDGVWYVHVRARSDAGEWSDAAHRAIRVDANPPQVTLAVDPPWPTGHNGWYVSPLTVTVSATDTTGSGVAAVEVSTDNATWLPYSAPLAFPADTASTTVWARATDFVGHTSEPISTTFKIDRTPPSSHVSGGQGPGAWVATVITNTQGNAELVLAGAITDTLSGRVGLDLGFDNLDWTSADPIGSWYPIPGYPQIEVNWYFTATTELGRGNHIFYGRAQDEAGNLEAPYEIARVVWFPEASPTLGGSSMTASPGTVRPGEAVTFILAARNGGYQEALVAVTNTLPAGLALITDTLAPDVGYDPATRAITWPARLLWPGQWVWHGFQARADAGLGATSLESRATAHAFWPNTDLLPPDQRQRFLDHEQTVVFTATVAVNTNLPADADRTAPWAGLIVRGGQAVTGTEAALIVLAGPDARWMYLREWTLDPTTGIWTAARDSGWLPYNPTYIGTLLVGQTYTWTLSAGEGVKYLGVWVADGARNVSTLSEASLAFVNRLGNSQALADGQRVQYRGLVPAGTWAIAYLTTVTGDPDMYIWGPHNGFRPDLYSNDTVDPGQAESTGGQFAPRSGRYLLEVQAVGASEYQLALTGQPPAGAARHALAEKERPAHPLTISDPLSAGRAGTPTNLPHYEIYLPIVIKNR